MPPYENRARAALVTGSSRGIGLACADALAKAGFAICINCSSEHGRDRAEDAARAIAGKHAVETMVHVADVSSPNEAAALVKAVVARFGGIDVLVNNAGITRDKLIAFMTPEDFRAVLDVNLTGTFNCCKAAARPMMRQRAGRIINISSVVGVHGNAGQVNYAASKAGVIGITKSLAKELGSRNVTVNAVAPGFIETDMTRALDGAQRAAIAERIGAGRLGTPEDVGAVVAFLASDDANYITGQTICVDGGLAL